MPGTGTVFVTGFPQSMIPDTSGLKFNRRKLQKISGSQQEKVLFHSAVPSLGNYFSPRLLFLSDTPFTWYMGTTGFYSFNYNCNRHFSYA